MSCECLIKSLEKLKEDFDDPDGSFNTAGLLNFKTGKASTRWPPLIFSYRRKKKDKSYMKNPTYIHISCNYCPICGIKYE